MDRLFDYDDTEIDHVDSDEEGKPWDDARIEREIQLYSTSTTATNSPSSSPLRLSRKTANRSNLSDERKRELRNKRHLEEEQEAVEFTLPTSENTPSPMRTGARSTNTSNNNPNSIYMPQRNRPLTESDTRHNHSSNNNKRQRHQQQHTGAYGDSMSASNASLPFGARGQNYEQSTMAGRSNLGGRAGALSRGGGGGGGGLNPSRTMSGGGGTGGGGYGSVANNAIAIMNSVAFRPTPLEFITSEEDRKDVIAFLKLMAGKVNMTEDKVFVDAQFEQAKLDVQLKLQTAEAYLTGSDLSLVQTDIQLRELQRRFLELGTDFSDGIYILPKVLAGIKAAYDSVLLQTNTDVSIVEFMRASDLQRLFLDLCANEINTTNIDNGARFVGSRDKVGVRNRHNAILFNIGKVLQRRNRHGSSLSSFSSSATHVPTLPSLDSIFEQTNRFVSAHSNSGRWKHQLFV